MYPTLERTKMADFSDYLFVEKQTIMGLKPDAGPEVTGFLHVFDSVVSSLPFGKRLHHILNTKVRNLIIHVCTCFNRTELVLHHRFSVFGWNLCWAVGILHRIQPGI